MDWTQIAITAVPLLLSIGFIGFRVQKITNALKECSDVLLSVSVAFGDDSLSKEEINEIKKQGVEAAAAIKAVFK